MLSRPRRKIAPSDSSGAYCSPTRSRKQSTIFCRRFHRPAERNKIRAMSSRIAVLASGGGSNLQAILEHFDTLGDRRGGDVVLVASNRPDAGALERAARRDLPAIVLQSEKIRDGLDLAVALREHRIDLIVLAGYLKL